MVRLTVAIVNETARRAWFLFRKYAEAVDCLGVVDCSKREVKEEEHAGEILPPSAEKVHC